MKITGRGRRGVHVLLFLLAICASQAGVAQEDREDEAARQKFQAIARAETLIMVPVSRPPRGSAITRSAATNGAPRAWPPESAEPMTWYISSGVAANSVFGDGRLGCAEPSGAPSDTFTCDPMNPVPSLGGGVCCNRDASLGGSFDQRGIEARADVLVHTSEPLEEPLEVTGSVRATLFVSSDAKDTDFTVRLVDVWPDGTAYNVDDTIFRARYREGYEREVFMRPGAVYELHPTPLSTSWEFGKDHRIRAEISSSKFPQYMRNFNTGGDNVDETEGVVARNTVHHSTRYPTRIVLPVVPRENQEE